MFQKVLVANRGEIALRVMRTCAEMGIATVAVYSEADAKSLHVRQAQEAFCIGPAPAEKSYLNIDSIIDAALRTGVQAIHPGYGFLSENPDFAQACASAGLVFVGPSPEVLRLLGDKAAAKKLAQSIGVPVVAGFHGEDKNDEVLLSAHSPGGHTKPPVRMNARMVLIPCRIETPLRPGYGQNCSPRGRSRSTLIFPHERWTVRTRWKARGCPGRKPWPPKVRC